MKIKSIISPAAYYPEIFAYKKYFEKNKDINFEIIESSDTRDLLQLESDVYLLKVGFDPKWSVRNKDRLFIHDYTSCSVGKYSFLKNIVKRYCNYNADIKIFLNERVKNEFYFKNLKNNFIFREMGVDDNFFYNNEKKGEHEFIYAGTINSTRNIAIVLKQFSKNGRNLTLIGEPEINIFNEYKKYKNIKFTGRLNREDTAIELKKAIYGINITPNIYPFNFQTSTKTLEYCAANLKLICNPNDWLNDFMLCKNANFFTTDDFVIPKDLKKYKFITPQVNEYKWDKVLDKSKIKNIIQDKLKTKNI